MSTPQATWPAGVVARFITIAGQVDGTTTVDVSQRPRYISTDQLLDGFAACTGCGDAKRFREVDADCMGGPEHALAANTDAARTWAQFHAEKCRELAKPGPVS